MQLPDFKPREAGYESVYYGINHSRSTKSQRRKPDLQNPHVLCLSGLYERDTAIQKLQNWPRNMDVRQSLHLLVYNFSSVVIAVSLSVLARLTPNLRIFLTSVCFSWLCGSRVFYPIIHGLVPSRHPQFEIRQWNPYLRAKYRSVTLLRLPIISSYSKIHLCTCSIFKILSGFYSSIFCCSLQIISTCFPQNKIHRSGYLDHPHWLVRCRVKRALVFILLRGRGMRRNLKHKSP